MTGRAIHLRDFDGMGKFFDIGVAGYTSEIGVNAGFVFRRINKNTLPFFRLQIDLRMAGEAISIGIGRRLALGVRAWKKKCNRGYDCPEADAMRRSSHQAVTGELPRSLIAQSQLAIITNGESQRAN